jgi:hypothetical protein
VNTSLKDRTRIRDSGASSVLDNSDIDAFPSADVATFIGTPAFDVGPFVASGSLANALFVAFAHRSNAETLDGALQRVGADAADASASLTNAFFITSGQESDAGVVVGPLEPLGTNPGPISPTDVSWISGTATTGGTGSSGTVGTASNFHINLVYDAAAMAAPQSFRDGVQTAMNLLSAALSDSITINIKIDYSGTGGGAAAGPDNGLYESYSSVRSYLVSNASVGDTSFNSLPDTTSIQGKSSVAVWNAQLKLFGLMSPNDTTTDDGSATFATDINPNLLVGVALHELTHALGRVPYGSQPDVFDFYRFTSTGTRLFSGASTAPAAYFSLDGGATKIADYGQTSDPSDFLNSGVQGANDPYNEFYTSSTLQQLTTIDLEQLDALGFHLTSASLKPVVSSTSFAIPHGTTSVQASLLFSVTDPENNAVTAYRFWDGTSDAGSGHFALSGVVQAKTGSATEINASQLPSLTFVPGTIGDDLWFRAYDGQAWSDWTDFTVGPPLDHSPIVSSTSVIIPHSTTSVQVSSLFSVMDADNDPITAYRFWDGTSAAGSGHFELSGVVQPKTGSAIQIGASQLPNLTFVPGNIGDDLWFRAYDGQAWSDWTDFTVGPPLDHSPVVSSTNLVMPHGTTSVEASSLFSVMDADNDPITAYRFWDGTTDAGSGHFELSGVVQAKTGSAIQINASLLSNLNFVPGTIGDDLWFRAYDGQAWSDWTQFLEAPPANHAPVVSSSNLVMPHGTTNVQASSLFSLTDADSDPITAYRFWDGTTGVGSGHFELSGAVQPKTGSAIQIGASQLSNLNFVPGTIADDLWFRAYDGQVWSDWTHFMEAPPSSSAPLMSAAEGTTNLHSSSTQPSGVASVPALTPTSQPFGSDIAFAIRYPA